MSSINVSIKDQNFRLNFNSLSEVDSIEVNGNTFNERYFTNYNRGALLPEIVMVSDKMIKWECLFIDTLLTRSF